MKKPPFGKAFPKHRGTHQRHSSGGPRPASSVNLERLAGAVGPDLLASALGISESQLRTVIRGGPDALDYRVHIAHRLDDTGFSSAWLDQPDARVKPAFVDALRKLAGASANPAPLRRQNLLKVASAIANDPQVLADALEMTEHSLERVLQGSLPIDDERFSHINPRLMAAGFPDGWLDQPRASVNPVWIAKLQVRSDGDEPTGTAGGPTAQPAAPSVEGDADPNPSPSSDIADIESAPTMESPPITADMTTSPEPVLEASHAERPPVYSSETPANAQAGSANGQRRRRGQGKTVATGEPKRQSPSAERKKSAAQMEVAEGQPPSVQTTAEQDGPSVPAAASRSKRGPREATHQAAPNRATLDKRADGAPIGPASNPSPRGAVAQRRAADSGRDTDRAALHATSLRRAEALDKLLSTARRGAKVTLWRDLLGLGLPYWGNVRRGALVMRDELAEAATRHLGLPEGWLDQPSFPPATVADWVMDADIALPRPSKEERRRDEESRASATEGSTPRPSQPSVLRKRTPKSRVEHSAGSAASDTGSTADLFAAAATAEVEEERLPTPVVPALPAEGRRAIKEPGLQPAVDAARRIGEFKWTPADAPQPRTAPGPLVEALSLVLNHLSVTGQFTDDDALRMMAMFTAKT